MTDRPRIDYHRPDRIFYELNFLAEDRQLQEAVRACIEAQKLAGGEALRSRFRPNPDASEVAEAALQRLLGHGAHQPSGIATEPEISNVLSFNYRNVQGSVFDAELGTLRKRVDALMAGRILPLFVQGRRLDIKNSGHFWYPPGGFMGWHTNLRTPGWRLYINYCEEPDKSFFRYRDPETGRIVTAMDRVWNFRLFKIDEARPFWHAIYSDTNRFSLGYKVTPKPGLLQRWQQRLATAAR